jgi:hypothetical protein
VTDPRSLSRRKLLLAVATTGAAASTGSGAAAMFHDSETTTSAVTAGTLDLELGPWASERTGTSPFEGGTISSGDDGREYRELSISDNPGYLWFRTACACDPVSQVEEALFLQFGVDEDGDGTVDRWLTDAPVSLREARERFGDGVSIGELPATTTWRFVVDWDVEGNVADETTVEFDFVFYATQSRHVMNVDAVAPDWSCDCGGTGGPEQLPGISWVAFGASEPFSKEDLAFSRSDDERTLVLESVPNAVETVVIKYGTLLDVFDYSGQSSLDVGKDGYEQQQNAFPETEPTRSNSVPCPEAYGCKYEFGEATAWECKDRLNDGSSGDESSGNDYGVYPPDEDDPSGPPNDERGPPDNRGPPNSLGSGIELTGGEH